MTKLNRKATLDDGCNPELVQGCVWSGELEIPTIKKPDKIIIPPGFLPPYCRLRNIVSLFWWLSL